MFVGVKKLKQKNFPPKKCGKYLIDPMFLTINMSEMFTEWSMQNP